MKNYFDFIMFLAFRASLSYESKRSLTLEQLHNYRLEIVKKDIEFYKKGDVDNNTLEEILNNFHRLNINMSYSDEIENFESFIIDNKDLFEYKDEIIYLKNNVSLEQLENENSELDCYTDKYDKSICGGLLNFFDCIECLNILNIKKIKNEMINLIKLEKKLKDFIKIWLV